MKIGTEITISVGEKSVHGDLSLVKGSTGIVLFAYGSGSSRFSPRERYVSGQLDHAGLSTLFIDLLTEEEGKVDEETAEYRFNIPLLASRLEAAVKWARQEPDTQKLKMGLFGGSTGASACLIAAARQKEKVSAVVSRGGRTDLADSVLPDVTAATLFIVGGNDEGVLSLNERSLALLGCKEKKLEIISGATHLFEEPGKLVRVAELAVRWFARFLC